MSIQRNKLKGCRRIRSGFILNLTEMKNFVFMSINGPSAITAFGYLNVFTILRGKKLKRAK